MGKISKTLILILMVLGIMGGLVEFFSPSVNIKKNDFEDFDESVSASLLAPIISAKGAILINADDGSVIYEKDADTKLYPASTTKIMTVLVALEIMKEIDAGIDSQLIVPQEAIAIEGSSIYLEKDEIVRLEELLYGSMLASGNDAATALAVSLGGNLGNFVEKMNSKAQELGCKNTHFVNPTGLFHENHFTTARDLAKIAMAAMKNELFAQMAGSISWDSEESGRSFNNKNKTLKQYEGATGVKIGYTKISGRTLVASAKRGEVNLIAVVLDDENWFEDAYALLDYGFMRIEDDRGLE